MPEQAFFVYVEDEPMSRMVMEMLMTHKLGYQIAIFEDSANFIGKMEALPQVPKIIFLDIHVHPYTGFEMLEMLREHPNFQAIPVVALTASVMNEEVEMLRDSGFNGVIAKPIDAATFPSAIESILAGNEIWQIF